MPPNSKMNQAGPFLTKKISELGAYTSLDLYTIKNAEFTGSISSITPTGILYRIDYHITILSPDGTEKKLALSHIIDISKQIPEPSWVEPDMMNNLQKRTHFESMFLEQAMIRFPEDNIYDIHILGAKLIDQTGVGNSQCRLLIEIDSNEGKFVLVRNSRTMGTKPGVVPE